ncbi:MAG TPA: penicillin-binding transpeptidase domain-containing protein [Polyangiaceae bacterium]
MRPWIGLVAAATCVAAFVPLVQHRANADEAQTHPASAPRPSVGQVRKPPALPPLAGIEMDKVVLQGDQAVAPGPIGRVARLSLDPELQRATQRVLREYAFPEAAVVVLDTAGGRVLVWASQVAKGPVRDLCAEANAPAASIFKIVTGAALVETAGLSPDSKQCYSGGESRITALDLVEDPRRDRWCATLGEAMGRSLNTVFARLALKNLAPVDLAAMAGAFGFGDAVPFDVPVAASAIHIPDDRLGFARTAAGFWNTTMSPLEAATIANTVANRGEMLRPVLVESVSDPTGTVYQAPKRIVLRRAVHPETAVALTSMMESTVTAGTSYRAFHDGEGRAFLPNITIAGKTGTLTRAETQQFYTWFVGFAPSRAPEIAMAVLVINTPSWRAKANVVAREVLRAYFAGKGAPGVTKP